MHGKTWPAGGQVNFLTLPVHLVGTQDLLRGRGQQFLKEVHHVVKIGIGLIKFDSGKLRVVFGIHTLVAENTPNFIHPIHAAYDEPLQRQFSGNAHEHIDVQSVMMGDEGTSGSPAGDGVKYWSLHLYIAPSIHKIAHMLDELRTDNKVSLHLGVDNQIHIALAITQLGIGKPVKLLRQRQQSLAQQSHLLHPHRHFSSLGAEYLALHAYDIADIVLLKAVILLLIQLILPGVELDAAGLVLQIAEGHFAHATLGHKAAGKSHLFTFQGVKVFLNISRLIVYLKVGDVKGITALFLKFDQLLPANQSLLRKLLYHSLIVSFIYSFIHIYSPLPFISRVILLCLCGGHKRNLQAVFS